MTLSCKYSCFHQHIKPISIILMSLTTALNPFLRFKSSTVGGARRTDGRLPVVLFVCRERWGRVLLPGAGKTGRRERRVAVLLPATYDSFCVITGNEYL